MRALVFTAPETLEIQEVAPPRPRRDQTLVEVALCGICGSDMHAWHGHDARRVPPMILGHEGVGVAASGPFAGKRVAINPLMTCGRCSFCVSGRSHLCRHREMIGMRMPGAFAEEVIVATRNLTILPDDLPFGRAVLAEPLACAIHAVGLALRHQRALGGGTEAVVLGGGAIGLLSALVLRAKGVSPIHIAETNARRRAALEVLFPGAVYDPADPAYDSLRADMVLDAVGTGRTRAAASRIVAPGGVIMHIGLQDNADGLDTRRLTLQEVAFMGAYCYLPQDFATAIEMLRDWTIDPAGWSTLRDLGEGAACFAEIDAGEAPAKLILQVSETADA
ncbi:MAG: alcohol dehydrogenase catalytic domain-containing protein [Pseudomonadota bacterium]